MSRVIKNPIKQVIAVAIAPTVLLYPLLRWCFLEGVMIGALKG